jgi:hypothetical protein
VPVATAAETVSSLAAPATQAPAAPAKPLAAATPDSKRSAVLPTIHLRSTGNDSEWAKWLVLILVAIVTGVAGFFLVPVLVHLKLL